MNLSTVLVVGLLVLVQVLAALPWVFALTARRGSLYSARAALAHALGNRNFQTLAGFVLGMALLLPLLMLTNQTTEMMEFLGRTYGALLQLQLTVGVFVVGLALLLKVWPKGGAVAQAAFREGVRQPMFWLLMLVALFALTFGTLVPYFTFGEDYVMVKVLGYDWIMLAAVIFGVLAATLFVSEEIEGRTAITLMSKPISRRQFLLGKYAGILLACLLLFGLLGWYFELTLLFKQYEEWSRGQFDVPAPPAWLTEGLARLSLSSMTTDLLRGVGLWAQHTLETLPGLVLTFCQVLVLVSLSVTLATRLPMVVNLVTVLVIYFVANLNPVLVAIGAAARRNDPTSPVAQLLAFTPQVFDVFLPGLKYFQVETLLVGEAPDPGPLTWYILSVLFYGVLYTGIALLFGLVLFEDRDLA